MIDEIRLSEKSKWYALKPSQRGHTYYSGWNDCNRDWIRRIEEMPKVGEWIPFTERLPERDDEYLVTINSDYFYGEGSIVIMTHSENKWWYYNDEQGYLDWFTDEVLAWMPLPEPYKEGDSKWQE